MVNAVEGVSLRCSADSSTILPTELLTTAPSMAMYAYWALFFSYSNAFPTLVRKWQKVASYDSVATMAISIWP